MCIRDSPVGGYQVDVVLHPIQFDYGIYTAKAVHAFSGTSESLTFEIKSAQSDIVTEIESQEPLTMEICKSNRAHVDEILKDMRSIGRVKFHLPWNLLYVVKI